MTRIFPCIICGLCFTSCRGKSSDLQSLGQEPSTVASESPKANTAVKPKRLKRFVPDTGKVVATSRFVTHDQGMFVGPTTTLFHNPELTRGHQVSIFGSVDVFSIMPNTQSTMMEHDLVRINTSGEYGWTLRDLLSDIIPVEREDNAENIDTTQRIDIRATAGSQVIKRVPEFTATKFVTKYQCNEDSSWPLRSGGVNRSYRLNIYPTVTLEITEEKSVITGFGLMFFNRDYLNKEDRELIIDLLTTMSNAEVDDNVIDRIMAHSRERVFQIRKAPSVHHSTLEIWSGLVGAQQIISVEVTG